MLTILEFRYKKLIKFNLIKRKKKKKGYPNEMPRLRLEIEI